jgi:hypothetical protein
VIESKLENPRLSTTSSTDEEGVQFDHLVIAQVHHQDQHQHTQHHPILESHHENEADDEDSDDLGERFNLFLALNNHN